MVSHECCQRLSEREAVANPTIVADWSESSAGGYTGVAEASISQFFSRGASGMELVFFDREDDGRPSRVIPIDPDSQSHISLLARLRARRAGPARSMASGLTDRSIPRVAFASIRPSCCSTLTAAPWWFRRTTAATRRMKGDNTATAMKSVVVDPHAYDWEGDAPLEAALLTHNHLRDARARLYRASQLRRGGIETWDIRRV